MAVELISTGPIAAPGEIILAHGAGVGSDSPFMVAMAAGLADRGWRVHRFDFPYMARQRARGRKAPPDRPEILSQVFRDAVDQLVGSQPLFIGGKSMGGRLGTVLLDELAAKGQVRGGLCLGYPFHPLGKPQQVRTQHLAAMATPCLIVQGERDPMGRREEVEAYPLSDSVRVDWIPDGDHSFTPRKRSGRTEPMNWALAMEHAHGFMDALLC